MIPLFAAPLTRALEHRKAIGRRFAARIASRDAVFMQGGVGPGHGAAGHSLPLPCTVADDGSHRAFSGANRFMLMQVMQDQGWSDPRFFTAAQAAKAGWSLAHGAKPIGLQFLASTGNDGLPLETPTAKRFGVFNACEFAGVPALDSFQLIRDRVSVEDITVALNNCGFSVPVDAGFNGVRDKVFDWVASMQARMPVHSPALGVSGEAVVGADQAALRVTLAVALIERQSSGFGGGSVGVSEFAGLQFSDDWVRTVEANPLSIFHAINDAEKLAAQAMIEIHAARIERERMTAPSRAFHNSVGVGNAAGVNAPGAADVRRKGVASARVEVLFAERVAVLAVPFSEKDRAASLGAVFYPPQSLWFVPPGADPALLKEWSLGKHALGVAASHDVLISSFETEMVSMGLDVSKGIKADGKWHNVSVDSKSGPNKSGSYILNLDGDRTGAISGMILNKHTGEQHRWQYEGALLTPEQRGRIRAQAIAREAQAALEVQAAQDAAAVHACSIWDSAGPADGHGYVVKKRIVASEFKQISGDKLLNFPEFIGKSGVSIIRANEDYLLVPMRNAAGDLRAVQAISADGAVKSFMKGAQKKGTMLVLGVSSFDALCQQASPPASVSYVEGVATGASLYSAGVGPVVICFDAGNLEAVGISTIDALPAQTIPVIAIDNDQFHVERALGFLSVQLGVNPHSPSAASLNVTSGASKHRSVRLGGAVADGQWQQANNGSYCMRVQLDDANQCVRALEVECVPNKNGRKSTITFVNRGAEVGLKVMAATAKNGISRAIVVAPEFASLKGRPTDWNDLARVEGLEAVRGLFARAGLNAADLTFAKNRIGNVKNVNLRTEMSR